MSKFCTNCGAELGLEETFCSHCGSQVQKEVTRDTKQVARNLDHTEGKQHKKKSIGKMLFMAGVPVALCVIVLYLILSLFGKDSNLTESSIGDLSAFSYTEEDYEGKAMKGTVSPEEPLASMGNITIDFGEYGLDAASEVQIKELPVIKDKKNGVKLTAYDISMGDKTAFDDVILITIPYDEKYVESGAEGECVGAKYYNQATKEWEGVYYELDTERQLVLIYTTHLSTYGVFQVKNENTRKAYISDVYAIASLMNTGKSFAVIKELADTGDAGNAAFEAGFEVLNYVVGNTGTAVTAATLGGQYEGALADTLGKGTQHLGLAFSVVQTCYDFTYHFSDDQGKLNTLANFSKNIVNNAVGYFGSAALQTAFAGITVFDTILSTVQSDMVELKLENIGDVYQYYNDVEAPRLAKEWRKIFITILKNHGDDPETAQKLIEEEIDSFCARFWDLGYGRVKEVAGVSGKKYSFDEREWTKDREVLTAQYRAHLLNRLQAPLTSARNYLLKQAQEQAQKELEKQLRVLQIELNRRVQFEIMEEPDEEGKYKYAGYTVRFATLSSNANIKSWSGKMSKDGVMSTSFTILGHLQAGLPTTIELYPPGEDTPELVVPFKVAYPKTQIYLASPTEKEEKEPDVASEEQTEQTIEEKEYAWVLVDTIQEARTADVENTNKNGIYYKTASASSGSYSFTWEYVGESDDYYDPDMLHGESYGTQLTISVPPKVIRAGETVSLSFQLSFTAENLSFFDGSDSCRADWGNMRFNDENEKSFFEIYSSVKYKEKNVSSVSGTISAVIPAGYSEGDREELWTGGYAGTYYVYEWQLVN